MEEQSRPEAVAPDGSLPGTIDTWSTVYDKGGRVVASGNPNGYVLSMTYDALSRVTGMDYSDPNTADVSFTYDAAGRRTAMTDGLGATTFAYDALSRLVSVTDPMAVVVSYDYDAAGRRTAVDADGQVTSYSYDDGGRLTDVVDWDPVTSDAVYAYDDASRLTGMTMPNGVQATFQYDDDDRLTLVRYQQGGQTLMEYSYTLDDVGNRTAVTEVNREIVTTPCTPPPALPPDTPVQDVAAGDVSGLAAAIDAANAGAGPAIISLAPDSTYTLTAKDNDGATGGNGLPVITGEVTIHGNCATLERSAAAVDDFRLFSVAATGSLTTYSLTVSGGQLSAAGTTGGAIHNEGDLTLVESTVTDSSAGTGGGLYSTGASAHLTVIDSILEDNTATGQGGAVYAADGTNHSVEASCLVGNSATAGSGIYSAVGSFEAPGNWWGTADGPGGDGPGSGDGINTTVDYQPYNGDGCGEAYHPLYTPTLTVTRMDDPAPDTCAVGDCSLREAVIAANGNPGADTIALAAGAYTLTLDVAGEDAAASGDLDITDDLTIFGAGADQTTVQGVSTDRIFHVVSGSAEVELAGFTARDGGTGSLPGGGVFNSGLLTLNQVTLSDNTAASGAGVYNDGTLTVQASVITGGTVGYYAGAIYNTTNGVLDVVDGSSLTGNTAVTGGGAILNDGAAAITDSAIQGNEAHDGGGLYNRGTLTVSASLIEENTATVDGGGLYNWEGDIHGSDGGTAALDGRTIVRRNSAVSDDGVNTYSYDAADRLVGQLDGEI